ncbi:MEI1 protein [Trifolium medium]|uniref:MEI1 protein n=1 Tax=Trifolium medium TaxID=97028 RepID=A0A392M9Q3_9FABA|nr:MEI1 protein [Trifolium medium]
MAGSSKGIDAEETIAAQQRLIDADCHSFYTIGFSKDMFEVKTLKDRGYDFRKLINLINPISKIIDLDVLRKLFRRCTRKNDFWCFTDYIVWLKNDDRGKPLLEEALATIAKPLEESHVDLARKMLQFRASRRIAQKDITDQREKLLKCQQELQTKALNIKQDLEEVLGPLYEFEDISMEQLRIKTYKLYEADCRLKGITPISKIRSKGFTTAIDMFGETVKEEHFLDFVNQPRKKLEIENHFEKGILMLNEKGDLVINAAGEEEGDFMIGENDDLVYNAADGEKGDLMM